MKKAANKFIGDWRITEMESWDELVFRYDNTPHFPNLPSFPHHKHVRDAIVASNKPDLLDVLQEANQLLIRYTAAMQQS